MLYMFTTDPIRIGVLNIVQGVGNIFGGVVLGALIYKMKHVPIQFFVGTFIQTLFLGLYALITPETLSMALAFQFFANIPFAWLTLLSNVTAGLHVPQKDLGLAYGLIGTFRSLGGSIGTAVLTVILTSKANQQVPERIIAAVTPLGFSMDNIGALIPAVLSGSPAAIAAVPGASAEVVVAAVNAVHYAFGISLSTSRLMKLMPFVSHIWSRSRLALSSSAYRCLSGIHPSILRNILPSIWRRKLLEGRKRRIRIRNLLDMNKVGCTSISKAWYRQFKCLCSSALLEDGILK